MTLLSTEVLSRQAGCGGPACASGELEGMVFLPRRGSYMPEFSFVVSVLVDELEWLMTWRCLDQYACWKEDDVLDDTLLLLLAFCIKGVNSPASAALDAVVWHLAGEKISLNFFAATLAGAFIVC